MRKIADIKNDIAQRLAEAKNSELAEDVRAAAVVELRKLNDELQSALIVEAAERATANNKFSKEEKETAQRFSFVKFLREAADGGGLTGLELEMSQEAVREARLSGIALNGYGIPYLILAAKQRAATGQNVTTAADGGNLVQKEPLMYIEALRAKLILAQMGAVYLAGLVGNLPIAKGSAISASWAGETDEVAATKKSVSKSEMAPKRLAITTAYSRQLLIQTSGDVDTLIMDDMVRAHSAALEAAAIQGGGSNEPTGILGTSGIGSVVIGTNGGAITWAKLVELETKVSGNNADFGVLGYLTNSKVMGALKTIERATGTARFLYENKEANGYQVGVTNNVPSNLTKGEGTALSAMIFGNFSDLIIGQWGGLDIVVDPYTLKKKGEVETTINAFHDIALRRTESFAAIKDLTT
jgi:HK97 family phage major capsid protein